ncbi:hypothetical protein [Bacillus sp. OK048]|nr:hypothetical protein [Bacillus sp. OK048]
MATTDEAGYIRIIGGKNEVIKKGAYNIFPQEKFSSLILMLLVLRLSD